MKAPRGSPALAVGVDEEVFYATIQPRPRPSAETKVGLEFLFQVLAVFGSGIVVRQGSPKGVSVVEERSVVVPNTRSRMQR